ncbi:TLR4 interactor with leucine rich repeats-like [Branchiostoma lanceolatum]|uniref:TLR4 interactor with leucine rich repeats-like n=1 Tax=Branchiostoma lanceolatum TaxID=7740 RepID=UPI003452776D
MCKGSDVQCDITSCYHTAYTYEAGVLRRKTLEVANMATWCYMLFWIGCLVSMAMTSAEVACSDSEGVCDCSNEQTVDCRYKDMEEFPREIPADTVTLHVEGNFITELRTDDLAGLAHLEKLNLHFNSINDIEDESFNDLENLQHLALDYNMVTVVTDRTFAGLDKLSFLSLIQNNISVIEEGSFQNLGSLKVLDLSFNKITAAGVAAILSGLEGSLKELGLRYNMLQEIPAAVGLLENLQTLNLAGNNISSISPIQNMTSLLTLDLSNNRVMHLDPGMFQNMEKLEVLSLAYNRVGMIAEGVLANLTELRSLDLQGNNVQRLTRGMLSNVATNSSRLRLHLRWMNLRAIDKFLFQDVGNEDAKIQIDLRNNRLKLFPPGLCRSLPEGQLHFKLSGNPWLCDCRMERVPDLCPTAIVSRIRCAQPEALYRRLLGTLGADDLVCEPTEEPDGETDSVE